MVKGVVQPDNAAERLLLAYAFATTQRYAAAARLYADVYAANPHLACDESPGPRYDAACTAALAGCRQGKDAATLGEDECARLRLQALSWLRADLIAWRNRLEKEPEKARPMHWLEDTDLARVRNPQGLAQLPEAERRMWRQFWSEVQRLVDRAEETAAAPPKKP
jgi:serine/threonine-protein kinase